MSHNVYKNVEIIGTSPKSLEDAIKSALGRAAKTVRNMRWFEVREMRGAIKDGDVSEWQVTIKVGFALDE